MPPPLSGGAVDMGLVRCWSGIAATAKADGEQTIAGADRTVTPACGTMKSSTSMEKWRHSSLECSSQSWQCSPQLSGSGSQRHISMDPHTQSATLRTAAVRTTAAPNFLNERNILMARKYITTLLAMSNQPDNDF